MTSTATTEYDRLTDQLVAIIGEPRHLDRISGAARRNGNPINVVSGIIGRRLTDDEHAVVTAWTAPYAGRSL